MKPKLFLLFIIYNLSFCIVATATIRYVSKTGSSTPPYTTWATASDSIQKCINICQNGDTVYVANGVYYETIKVNKQINLIGSSMDSTVITGAGSTYYNHVQFDANASIKNFRIIGRGISENTTGIASLLFNISIEYCRIEWATWGIFLGYSTSKINLCLFNNLKSAIQFECPADTCHPELSNSIILSKDNGIFSTVYLSYGGSPTIKNNIIIEEGNTIHGINTDYNKAALLANNIVVGYRDNVQIGSILDSVVAENLIAMFGTLGLSTTVGLKVKARNNIISNNVYGYEAINQGINNNYNLLWNNSQNAIGYAALGDSDIIADPMFVKDTVPTHAMNFDYHHQKYSPAIDKGDPNILDKDGTRSDIGFYGGPFGEIYTYLDLAPRPPRNLSALVDTNKILLKWNRNTEADTSFYKVYRDTVINFTIDSTRLISAQTDTIFTQSIPHKVSRYVYKITCVDKQGNESRPSEERVVNLTSINDYPMTINDYLLYQNYPNPFNPSTTIGYKLKERGYVKLMVYDIKGELVSVLVNQEQLAGYYEVEFDTQVLSSEYKVGRQFASGIYLYRLEVIGKGNIPVYTEMKKMLMIK